jgi:hypothetical protein
MIKSWEVGCKLQGPDVGMWVESGALASLGVTDTNGNPHTANTKVNAPITRPTARSPSIFLACKL